MEFGGTLELHDGDHVLSFYEGDDQLTAAVAAYLTASARDGDTVIVIATPEHRAAFTAALAHAGIAPDYQRVQVFDAAATLGRFMRDGLPEPEAFKDSVGRLLRVAAADGRAVRAYGEMVAMLWAAGNRAGAIALERLWNHLAKTTPFSLLCGYPCTVASDSSFAEDLASACHLHTQVAGTIEASRAFDGATDQLAEARAFGAEVLMKWGLGPLVEKCALILSELTSNAVAHARSSFSVRLLRFGDGVHVSVSDASPVTARLRQPRADQPNGRGLRVVSALASRWGQTPVDGGKRVWALVGVP